MHVLPCCWTIPNVRLLLKITVILILSACTTHFAKLYVNTGHLMSPFYANHYPNNQECRWFIKSVGKTSYISLRIKQMELAEGDVLLIDKTVKITDSIPNTSLVINKWLTLCWPACYFEFKSDNRFTAMGFYFELKLQKRQPGKIFRCLK